MGEQVTQQSYSFHGQDIFRMQRLEELHLAMPAHMEAMFRAALPPVTVPGIHHEVSTQTSPTLSRRVSSNAATSTSPPTSIFPEPSQSVRREWTATDIPTPVAELSQSVPERSPGMHRRPVAFNGDDLACKDDDHATTKSDAAWSSATQGHAKRRRLLPADPAAGGEPSASLYMQRCSSPSSSEEELEDSSGNQQHTCWY